MPKSKKGTIKIHTENIFPIIKKWLYSEHDIFIRELISNSFDAINKLKKIATIEKLDTVPDAHIDITIDKEKKTLSIKDTGLGMTGKEIETYITQMTFSGAEDFLKKYADRPTRYYRSFWYGLLFCIYGCRSS